MNFIEVIEIIGIFLIIYFTVKKFKFLVDDITYSDHKKLGKYNSEPVVLGGIFLCIVSLIYLNEYYNNLKAILFLTFILGLMSDKNLLTNPKLRFSIQIVIISLLVFFEDLRINQLRILVIDDLLSNYLFNFILTTFCLAILVNGSNFIDGLNGLLSGYFLGVILSILYIVNNFENISFLEIDILKVLFFSLLIFYLFNILEKFI